MLFLFSWQTIAITFAFSSTRVAISNNGCSQQALSGKSNFNSILISRFIGLFCRLVSIYQVIVCHQVEYIDEETLENEDEEYMTTDEEEEKPNNTSLDLNIPPKELESIELLKLFTEVQRLQRQAVGLKDKLKYNMKVHTRQNRFLKRIKEIIEMKKKVLNQKRKKKCRILLSLQDKIKEDTTGLVLAMPMRQTDDLKNFALSIYKYSPQAYIYIRNTLRTMLPSTEILDSWITAGYQPRNVIANSNLIKVVAEQTETQLSCKVIIG